jgi:hypothetical protein
VHARPHGRAGAQVLDRRVDLLVLDETLDLRSRQRRQQVGEKLVEPDPVLLRLDDELVVRFGQG